MQKFFTQYKFYILVVLTFITFLVGLQELIKPLFIAFIISYIFNKPVTYLEKLHINRNISTIFLISLLIAVIFLFTTIIVPILTQKTIIIINKLPFIFELLSIKIQTIIEKTTQQLDIKYINKIQNQIQEQIITTSKYILFYVINWFSYIFNIKNILYYLIITPFLIFYLTTDWPYVINWFLTLMPNKLRHSTYKELRKMDRILMTYLNGQSLICLTLMLLYSITLYLIGLSHAFTVGTIVGLLCFIPYVGTIVGFLLILLVALADFQSGRVILEILLAFTVLNIIENQILIPKIIGKKLGVPPLMLILAIIVSNYYFGLIGMFLAYPITAALFQTLDGQLLQKLEIES